MKITLGGCEVIVARTDSDYRRAFELRHQVYAEECQYEPRQADGLETDPDDLRAIHLIAQQPETQKTMGTVRIIVPTRNNNLPFHDAYQRANVRIPLSFANDNVEHIAEHFLHASTSVEISRLAVQEEHRCGHQRKQNTPSASFLLLAAATGLCAHLKTEDQREITGAYFITTQSVAKLAQHFGVTALKQIAPEIQHHGTRAAYWISTAAALADMRKAEAPLFNIISAELKDQLGERISARQLWMSNNQL